MIKYQTVTLIIQTTYVQTTYQG